MENCVFCKIIGGEIPTDKLFENDEMLIIKDIHPQAPVHLLMIPKKHFSDITELDEDTALVLGRCFLTLGGLVEQLGLTDGFRMIVNKGKAAGQTVGHLHVHILGGVMMNETIL